MLLFVIILSLFLATRASKVAEIDDEGSEKFSEKIILGDEAEIKDYSYQVALLDEGHFLCGGSIVDNSWILTAAHCTDGIKDPKNLTIRAGSTEKAEGGQLMQVSEIHQHPKYNQPPESYDYDIAMLKLSENLQFNANVSAIKVARREPGLWKQCAVAGWGVTNPFVTYRLPKSLQKITVHVNSKSLCQVRHGGHLTPRQICASKIFGFSGVCAGDSGSPLVCDGEQVGIVSFGSIYCALPLSPEVYTNLANKNIREFISDFTERPL